MKKMAKKTKKNYAIKETLSPEMASILSNSESWGPAKVADTKKRVLEKDDCHLL